MTKRKASAALDTGNESDQSNTTHDNNSNNSNSTTNTNHQQQVGRPNEVPSTGSGGGCDNGNGSQKSKKERADNWSSAEIQVLHRGIDSRRDIFYGPPNQATKKNRELAWEEITKEVNSVSTTPRSLGQVMKKFKNEKCRAKRKFIDAEKEGHNNLGNNSNNNINSNNTTNNHTNLNAQNHTSNQQLQSQQQQQSHHMTTADSMSSQPSSINVVKLAPQNVAKTMIDLPGHVQQIQMPNDDMVLIVPPEMDSLLSGMNIVSDVGSQQHNHHGQHTLQAINTGQGLVNGTMSNGMMTRTIPAGSMCSLVYSTGGEVCSEQHLAGSVANQNQLSSNHIGVNAQNLMHHRGSIEQNQGHQQQQHQQQHQPPHHHLHQHPQMQQQQEHPAPHQQQQQQHPHQSHQPAQHHQHHIQQNHVNPAGAIATPGGVPVESQLKNLLFNLLLKDGQHSIPALNSSQEHKKQRNDMLAVIASSLSKIEGHLSKISKAASTLFAQNMTNNSNDNGSISTSAPINVSNTSLTMSNSDVPNNSTGISGGGNGGNLNSQGGG